MQTNYRVVSSYEYDVISGQYKQANYQNEDYSFVNDFDFANILNATDENLDNNAFISNDHNFQNSINSNLSNYVQMSSIYAFRFRQGENELSSTKTQNLLDKDTMQEKGNDQKNNSLLKDLLNMA